MRFFSHNQPSRSAWLLAVFFALSPIGRPVHSADAGHRNVLLIISDDLTANALGCYGNPQVHTPALDQLAAQGVRFSRAYCQFPVCGPSRAALMSGMYAQSVGVPSNGAATRFSSNLGSRVSMPQMFKEAGWFTARVSKIYHMRVPGDITAGSDGPDHIASWTERYNCQGPEWMTPGQHEHLSNETLRRDPGAHYNLGFGVAFYTVRSDGDGSEQPDAQAAAKAIELMRRHREEPFFLAVGLVRPHVPLVSPAASFERYPHSSLRLPGQVENDWLDIPEAGIPRNSRSIGLDENPIRKQKVLSAYYAAVSFMDEQVGRILSELHTLGLEGRTLVVFTSDHGYHLGEHEFWQKMSLHEEATRVPLLIRMPGVQASESDSLAEAIDLFPTLAEWAGLPVPAHCQGVSLMPVLRNPSVRVRQDAYAFRGDGHLLRTERWAYLQYNGGGSELFDMEADPHQFTNLAEDPGHSAVLSELKERLTVRLKRMKP
jgi:iduronate 2-sulfatase